MKEIGGVLVASNAIDFTDTVHGRLTVQRIIGKSESKSRTLLWLAKCECGNSKEVTSRELSAGDTKSCGCLKKEVTAKRMQTHGWTGSREHKAWKRIKGRCLNPNSGEYEIYSKRGIDKELEIFENFLKEIGPIPDEFSGRVSVDRIDNTKGYVRGNIRWANDEQQARNKGKYKNNTSGITGVRLHTGVDGSEFWCASWYIGGKQRSKYFSLSKYGDELALFMAKEFREQQIELLNLAGAGYTENHGK